MASIEFPPGWGLERLENTTVEEFAALPQEGRKLLRERVLRDPWSAACLAYIKLETQERFANRRPPTPPSYIPPGWTVQRVLNPSVDDLASLSPEELTRYSESRKSDHAARAARVRAESGGQDNAPDPALRSTPLSTPADNRSPLVQAVQRAEFPEWGYVIFRTDYSDEARWDRFQEIVFDEMCNAQMSKESETDLQAVKDKLSFKSVEDPALAGASVADVKRYYHAIRSVGPIPPGLDMNMCMIVDKHVIASVLNKKDDEIPYLIGVDVTNSKEDGGYEGHFKVAIDSFLCELYPFLRAEMLPRELWPSANPIWQGND